MATKTEFYSTLSRNMKGFLLDDMTVIGWEVNQRGQPHHSDIPLDEVTPGRTDLAHLIVDQNGNALIVLQHDAYDSIDAVLKAALSKMTLDSMDSHIFIDTEWHTHATVTAWQMRKKYGIRIETTAGFNPDKETSPDIRHNPPDDVLPPGFEGFGFDAPTTPPVEDPQARFRRGVFLNALVGDSVKVGSAIFIIERVFSPYEAMAKKLGAKRKMFNLHQESDVVNVREQKGSWEDTTSMPIVLSDDFDSVSQTIQHLESEHNPPDTEAWPDRYNHPKVSLAFTDAIMNAKEGDLVGVLGNFLRGPKIRQRYKEALSTPVVVVNRPIQKGKKIDLPEFINFYGGTGTFRGKLTIFVSNLDENELVKTLLHEGAHVMFNLRGMPSLTSDLGSSTGRSEYFKSNKEKMVDSFADEAWHEPEDDATESNPPDDDWFIRYTRSDGTGLMHRSAFNMDLLDDDEDQELTELLNYGLRQPIEVPKNAVFAFTQEGVARNQRLLELLTKAAEYDVEEQWLDPNDYEVVWESDDGQVALLPLEED